eukprot:gnl/Spiro4/6990_TR3630_c0_g1_i1.p1 gnl/Spiro4/6990_TR3630_c0_g1~~gnl/Spiro4/6990_TR3630_c0_g1_i1.p1  ORF type:complete len:548 (+),score=137.83 gnl/Spiro4/6990_TR3630_c0_g1_i1:220-1644(+)
MYHDLDVTYTNATTSNPTVASIYPRILTPKCDVSHDPAAAVFTPFFPDFVGMSYFYVGLANMSGNIVGHWQSTVQDSVGNTTAYYDYYQTLDTNIPVRFHMIGYDTIFGSHPDEYTLDFVTFDTTPDPHVFNVPALCNVSAPVEALRENSQLLMFKGLFRPAAAHDDEYRDFTRHHGKNYDKSEYLQRRAHYRDSLMYIKHHNERHQTFKLKPTRFADWSRQEYLSTMLPTHKKSKRPITAPNVHKISGATSPASLDWRQKGVVGPPKDQAACGSCWAFSTTGALEGAIALKYGTLVSLSEQQLVDCSWDNNNDGCNGGLQNQAFDYIIANGGLDTEDTYGYLGANGLCKFNKSYVPDNSTVKSYTIVKEGDEVGLVDACATMGPVAVSIDASHPSFEFYSDGVYYEPDCKHDADDLDHAVLLVGYGTDPLGGDYWLVRNSWAVHWGNEGYIKMARNRNNNCGVATAAIYAIVA